jgi:transcriptional regulator with XRE-family HTH domain
MIGGELVKEARKRAALTQRELAERAGTTQSAIARLESGRTSPSFEDVERLMRLGGFQLIVELAPYDDSDITQALATLRSTEMDQRLARLGRSVTRLSRLREEAGLGG